MLNLHSFIFESYNHVLRVRKRWMDNKEQKIEIKARLMTTMSPFLLPTGAIIFRVRG